MNSEHQLTKYQKENYPHIIRAIEELNKEGIGATGDKIKDRATQGISHFHGVDVELGLMTLVNYGLLNVNNGGYSINKSKQEIIDNLLKKEY